MTKEEVKQEIKRSWRRLYPADKQGKGIICPLCGHGKGGDGIRENPKANKPHYLICFGCDFRGDIIDLIMKDRHITYNEALTQAANELGLSIDSNLEDLSNIYLPELPGPKASQPSKKKTQPEGGSVPAVKNYMPYYKECMQRLNDPIAMAYLISRGISIEMAKKHYIGYDPSWISPAAAARLEGQGNDWRPEPTERIIIPTSLNHYLARAVRPDDKIQKANETGGGGAHIFNSKYLKEGGRIFVTEGAFDALSIEELGYKAVALFSTANTGIFLNEIAALRDKRQLPDNLALVLCLDDDDPGIKAAEKLKSGLDSMEIGYITANITCGCKDPNEAFMKDRDKFKAALEMTGRPDNTAIYLDNVFSADIAAMKQTAGRHTGFKRLDKKCGGIYPGVYTLAAPSSLGKTTFALQIADNLAAQGHDVLFFSLEQSRFELVSKSLNRIVYGHLGKKGITSLDIREGAEPETVRQAIGIYKEITGGRLSIIEGNFNCDVSKIEDTIKEYIRDTGTRPTVFIDYLQIITPTDSKRTTKENTDLAITSLRRLARDYSLTVFAISSINRGSYTMPIDFESLKESGGIEYTSDAVWGLQLTCVDNFEKKDDVEYRRKKVNAEKSKDPRGIKLVCLKNRYGIATFDHYFNYYPANDYYEEDAGAIANNTYQELFGD